MTSPLWTPYGTAGRILSEGTSAGGAPAPRRPAARTSKFIGAPRPAGPQPRDGLRRALRNLQARLGRRGPSPATACGAHFREQGCGDRAVVHDARNLVLVAEL